MRSFENKKCLITGAASGIGRAVACALAKEGAILFLTDINQSQLEATVQDLQQQGARVAFWQTADIAQIDQVQAMAEAIHEQFTVLDVVMNIAGIAIWGTVDKFSHAQWKKVIDINLMGAIHVIESFIPVMIAHKKGGHLVNVSSAAGLFGLPWHAAYSASKFGLRGLSEVLRFDLKQHKIGVSLVCPGAVNTGLVQTIQVAGVDMHSQQAGKLKQYFQKVAVSPEQAATAILRGVKKNKYYIYTSKDIQVGFWLQSLFPRSYRLTMQVFNDAFNRAIQR